MRPGIYEAGGWLATPFVRDDTGSAAEVESPRRSGQERGEGLGFAHFAQGGQAALDGVEGVFAAFVFDDVPLGLAGAFAEGEDLLPFDFILADHGVGTAAPGLQMDRGGPSGVFVKHRDRVGAAFVAVAGVQLHDHFFAGVAEEQVPGSDAVKLVEIVRVGVVADHHALALDLRRDVVELFGFVEPLLAGLALHPGDDEVLVADGLIELNGFLEFGGEDGLVGGVGAAADELVVIEQFADGFGGMAVVAGELDAFIAGFGDGGEHASEVFLAKVADGIELEADRDGFSGGGQGGRGQGSAQSQSGGPRDKIAPGEVFGIHRDDEINAIGQADIIDAPVQRQPDARFMAGCGIEISGKTAFSEQMSLEPPDQMRFSEPRERKPRRVVSMSDLVADIVPTRSPEVDPGTPISLSVSTRSVPSPVRLAGQPPRPAWVEIDLGRLERNFQILAKDKPDALQLLSVVKDDGYGHGALAVAAAAMRSGARFLAVSTVEEAVTLRDRGVQARLLLLGDREAAELPWCLEYRLTCCVSEPGGVELLAALAREQGVRVPVHLKVNTGMNRYGVRWDQAGELATRIAAQETLRLEGVLSHFAQSDEADKSFAMLQLERFQEALEAIEGSGLKVAVRHLCNSGGFLDLRPAYFDMVRLGILPLGVYPSAVCRRIPGLQPVMSVKARIAAIQPLRPGDTVGYGMRFTATTPRRIAVLPIGYGDGFPRVRNQGFALVHGQRAPLVGGVAMDAITVDITEIPAARLWDEAVVMGQQGADEITVHEVARLKGSVSYDILTGWRSRLPRVYVNGPAGPGG